LIFYILNIILLYKFIVLSRFDELQQHFICDQPDCDLF